MVLTINTTAAAANDKDPIENNQLLTNLNPFNPKPH